MQAITFPSQVPSLHYTCKVPFALEGKNAQVLGTRTWTYMGGGALFSRLQTVVGNLKGAVGEDLAGQTEAAEAVGHGLLGAEPAE